MYQMNTGLIRAGFPSVGSWVTYGLGTENQDLPGFVVLQNSHGSKGGAGNWGAGFLPTAYQATGFRSQGSPILNLNRPAGLEPRPPAPHARPDRRGSTAATPSDIPARPICSPASRITSWPTACSRKRRRPSISRPRPSASSGSTGSTSRRHPAFRREVPAGPAARRARRAVRAGLLQRRVGRPQRPRPTITANAVAKPTSRSPACSRISSSAGCWSRRSSSGAASSAACRSLRKATAATTIRYGFLVWMAGGGVKGGACHGATDEIGWKAADSPVSVHDLHATILHLLGLDHKRLTYLHNGRRLPPHRRRGRSRARYSGVNQSRSVVERKATEFGRASLPVSCGFRRTECHPVPHQRHYPAPSLAPPKSRKAI